MKMVNKYIQKSKMKVKVFECLVKFLYKNKIKIKDNGNSGSLGIVFAEKIKQCLTDIKSDVMLSQVYDILIKVKKWKLIYLILNTLLSSVYVATVKKAIVMTFELYKEKIFKCFNIYDFNSVDKIKVLTKGGKLFKRLLHVVSNPSSVVPPISR